MPTDFNKPIIEEFRANEGRVGGWFEGSPLILLTTTGARTGRPNVSPLGYVPDGDRILVVASAAGAPNHPAWYHNLLADPWVTVELGTETFEANAVPLRGEERDRLFAKVVEVAPGYAEYQAKTSRIIPVVALYRTAVDEKRARAIGDELRELHDWFRQELAELLAEVRAHRGGAEDAAGKPAPALGQQLRERCLTFCEGLARHHGGEDMVVFPHLEDRFPQLKEALDRLRREHVTVERLRDELRDAVAALGTGDAAESERLGDEIERLAAELSAHFDYEEDQLVPALNSLTDAPWPSPR
ncbi:cation-binding protein [Microtetraspora sp. NBRC 13810]|uniref:nitroreductase/quinone reductase family protein n=1 Tax=Microtetraspora sp. NBRC 13810 TaxID=3030990 RepID=UPI0024A15F93|nr:nitroreductase/quinone reductase family protein [Microtetraspora sp. NBRC 13810]GLW06497.1 cation-binding protein [Microtetraspora sp. NBRC 13810]